MAVNTRPIGVFDSGIGGLTVVREIFRLLPNEPVLFFGDTARLPYGPKSKETVIRFCRQNARFLLSRGVRSIVVACNTASSVALTTLRDESPVPVIGVIEPGARAAARTTRSGVVGVIGTRGTVASGAYDEALHALEPEIRVVSAPSQLLVSLAEEGWTDHPVTTRVVEEYLAPLLRTSMDTLILGCTHFPVLKETISRVAGENVRIVDAARETARMLRETLPDPTPKGASIPSARFAVSDVPHRFRESAELFLGGPIGSVEKIDLEVLEEV
ncbi:MAG: glutamate racemase [Candidatus Eisenbacteria bacterium]|nr:glutamate racemase [Candidatus Eisenbacteria bacterium]